MPENTLFSRFTDADANALLDLHHPAWPECERVTIDRDWQGQSMLRQKGYNWKNLTEVASLWSHSHLFFFFQCWFDQLNLSLDRPPNRPVNQLWETDVVEVFLKPQSCEDYFELEFSPLGQWLDVHILQPRVDVNFNWNSHVRVRADIQEKEGTWHVIAAIPLATIAAQCNIQDSAREGQCWRLNLYRMAGEEPSREFLAWRPTFTQQPDFHVPSSFGNILFLRD